MFSRLSIATLLMAVLAASTGCQYPLAPAGLPIANNLPPAQQMLEQGPGVMGPGPAVLPPPMVPGMMQPPAPSVQVYFLKPENMQVRWDVGAVGTFDSTPLIVPGRHNFPQGGIFRLKITNIEGREGVELYPTLEIGPTTPRTAAYLGHNAIPVQFTEEDFDQVLSGNFVTKVIYLPDPEFQELALAGVETLVSTRLEAGVDPIVEADRRGAILAIIRLGNKDEEMPDSDANGGLAPASYFDGAAHPGGMPMMHRPGGMSMMQHPGGMSMMQHPGGMPMMHHTGGTAPNYVSGVTSPPWGMPITGTPIGLPGPTHIPLGGPAGLQEHTMRNHTHMWIPGPTKDLQINVQQSPGFSYPAPANRVYIQEETLNPLHINRQPATNMSIGRGRRTSGPHPNGCQCPNCKAG